MVGGFRAHDVAFLAAAKCLQGAVRMNKESRLNCIEPCRVVDGTNALPRSDGHAVFQANTFKMHSPAIVLRRRTAKQATLREQDRFAAHRPIDAFGQTPSISKRTTAIVADHHFAPPALGVRTNLNEQHHGAVAWCLIQHWIPTGVTQAFVLHSGCHFLGR